MTVKIEKQGTIDVLKIEIPIAVHTSASGKSTVIASTNGNKPTEAQYNGKVVILGLNAYTTK